MDWFAREGSRAAPRSTRSLAGWCARPHCRRRCTRSRRTSRHRTSRHRTSRHRTSRHRTSRHPTRSLAHTSSHMHPRPPRRRACPFFRGCPRTGLRRLGLRPRRARLRLQLPPCARARTAPRARASQRCSARSARSCRPRPGPTRRRSCRGCDVRPRSAVRRQARRAERVAEAPLRASENPQHATDVRQVSAPAWPPPMPHSCRARTARGAGRASAACGAPSRRRAPESRR